MTGPQVIRVDAAVALDQVLAGCGIPLNRPVLVVVGGAAGMTDEVASALAELLPEQLIPLLDRLGAVVVDGGTDAGVMRLMGNARTEALAAFPLIGVAAVGTVSLSNNGKPPAGLASIEQAHTHLVLVPGSAWGDESRWLSVVAQHISGNMPSATLLVNGGAITFDDGLNSLDADRPLIVLDGSGRAADEIARARVDTGVSAQAATIAASPLTHIVSLDDPDALTKTISAVLSPAR